MASIKFLGASGEVTGSSYLITGDHGETLLIDLGMFQGLPELEELNFSPLEFDPDKLSGVVITHAHLDHCGRLPILAKHGFRGKIYLTAASKDISYISLSDSASLAQEQNPENPPYTKEDVEAVYQQMEPVAYDTPLKLDEFVITLRNAGHILGSASIEVSGQALNSEVVVFSGDLGNTPQDLILPTVAIKRADMVVMESTYGNAAHPTEDVMAILQREINLIERDRGVLLIPAFSIERTQEIIHKIGHLKMTDQIKNQTPVFLDSPMAIEVMEVFKRYPKLYNSETSQEDHPFDFPNLILIKTVDESKAILQEDGPKVIIAGSGMMSGGRILHHLKNYVTFPTTRILIVGYQAEGTLGREIEEGAKMIRIYDEHLPVHASITKLDSLSSHADQPKLIDWLSRIQGVKQVFLVHGEDPQRTDLSEKIKEKLGVQNVVLPVINQLEQI